MASYSLEVHAGGAAREALLRNGLRPELFGTLVGASGGPKWLVLSALDRLLFPWLGRALEVRHLRTIGSSIGAWRNLCLALPDPAAAIRRLEHAYIDQRYDTPPTPAEVSAVAREMLAATIGTDGPEQVVHNRAVRTHIIAVRAKGPWRSQNTGALLLASALTAGANAISREALGSLLERTCFHTGAREAAPEFRPLATRYVPLAPPIVPHAALASASIPLVMSGVETIEPGQFYWDGGMSDYHFEPDFGRTDGLILYPHFYPHLIPGWFDKPLAWRRNSAARWPTLVLLCPSREFVSRLPFGKIPDRRDFRRMGTEQRQACWRRVADESARLAEEFAEICEGRGLEERLAP